MDKPLYYNLCDDKLCHYWCSQCHFEKVYRKNLFKKNLENVYQFALEFFRNCDHKYSLGIYVLSDILNDVQQVDTTFVKKFHTRDNLYTLQNDSCF